jgi:hypothetical protein
VEVRGPGRLAVLEKSLVDHSKLEDLPIAVSNYLADHAFL